MNMAVPNLSPEFEPCLVYIGTYTSSNSKGIYASHLNTYGRLGSFKLAVETPNPSFLVAEPAINYDSCNT